MAPLGHVGAADAVVHLGRLQGWITFAEQVHASCAPERKLDVPGISPDVLQSDPVPSTPQVTTPAPSFSHIGVPVMQVGDVPVQKRFIGAAPEI